MAEYARCNWCGRTIRWIVTQNGKNMPVDPPRKPFEEPFPVQANVYVNDETSVGRVVSKAELSVWSDELKAKLYLAHFVTCPARLRERKRQLGAAPRPRAQR